MGLIRWARPLDLFCTFFILNFLMITYYFLIIKNISFSIMKNIKYLFIEKRIVIK